MTKPALVLGEGPERTVAGLSVLDRLVVGLHRAGFGPISVLGEERPLRRADALGVEVDWLSAAVEVSDPSFVVSDQLLLDKSALAAVTLEEGCWQLTDGERPLPAGVLTQSSGASLEDLAGCPKRELAGLAVMAEPPHGAERALWASLRSSADGLVDRFFNRPLGRVLVRVLVHTEVSPNLVSVVAALLGLIGALVIGLGHEVWGCLLFQSSAVVDCMDGDLARATFRESKLGWWLDIGADQVVHIAIFISLAVNLGRAGSEAPVLALAVSVTLGVLISFAVVLTGLLRKSGGRSRFQRLIDSTTNRDFSVVLLVLAALQRLEWALWLFSVGVHIFWLLALAALLTETGADD